MSLYIIVSQSARLMAVWTRNRLMQQALLSVSILAYSALLIDRNRKINAYYKIDSEDDTGETNNSNGKPRSLNSKNKELS